jgi:hypothetical protein
MVNPSKDKGDRFEWHTINMLGRALKPFGLIVERTRAGYQRDAGDVHVLTPDREVLFTLQCKNYPQARWELPAWLRQLHRQRLVAGARFGGFLVLKRPRVLDAEQSYALLDLASMAALVGGLWAQHQRDQATIVKLRAGRVDGAVSANPTDAACAALFGGVMSSGVMANGQPPPLTGP